jgi:hypothetical protein
MNNGDFLNFRPHSTESGPLTEASMSSNCSEQGPTPVH